MIRYREILRLYSQGISKPLLPKVASVLATRYPKWCNEPKKSASLGPSRQTLPIPSCKSACFPSQICPRIASCRITRPFIKNWLKAALH